MGDRGGLGRSLDDIRADLEDVRTEDERALGLFNALERITEGADTDEPEEFAVPSPEQLWARLILEEPAERLAQLRALLAAAERGAACADRGHEQRARVAELRHQELLRTIHAGRHVRVLCVDDVPVSWIPEDESREH